MTPPAPWCELSNGLVGEFVGDPVSVVTGAMVDQETDFHLADTAFPFSFVRRYDSRRYAVRGATGHGFRHDLEVDLRADVDGLSFIDAVAGAVGFPFVLRDGESVTRSGYTLRRRDARIFDVEDRRGHVFELELPRDVERRAVLRAYGRARGARFAATADEGGRPLTLLLDRRRLRFEYAGDALAAVWLEAPDRPRKALARYQYDGVGRLVEATDVYGHAVRYGYGPDGRVAVKADRRGYRFFYEYDAEGRCVRTWGEDGLLDERLAYRPLERTTIVTRADGAERVYLYDALGVIRQHIDAGGCVTAYEVDAEGRPVVEIDPLGNRSRICYDARGSAVAKVDPLGHVRRLPADPTPHPLSHREPETPLEWQLGFAVKPPLEAPDEHFFRLGPVSEDVARWLFTGAEVPQPPREVRDEHGLLIREESATGEARRYAYDPNGFPRWITDFDGTTRRFARSSWNELVEEVDGAGNATRYGWAPNDKLATVIDPGGTRTDFVYDKKDRLVEVHRHGRLRERYVYDVADNLVAKLDGRGNTLLTRTIGPGNLVSRREYGPGEFATFAYDAGGRVIAADNGAAACRFAYDRAGRRSEDSRVEEGAARGVTHRYDRGRLVETVVLGRFAIGCREEGSDTRVIVDPTGREHRLRVRGGGVFEREDASGAVEVTQYDLHGRCIARVTEMRGATPRAWARRFVWSPDGDLLAREDSLHGVTRYRRDAARRLASVERPDGGTDLYHFDAAGNLVEAPGFGATLCRGNQLLCANGDEFEYDDRDHVSERRGATGTTRYRYDRRDQLIAIDAPGLAYRAEHDVLGRRVRKTVKGETWHYYWDTDRLAAEVSPDGGLRVYVYADAGALVPMLVIAYAGFDTDPGDGRRFHLDCDHLGAPEAVRDEGGAVVWRATYDPYGRARILVGAEFHQPLRWPGHYFDAETGLHENRFRSYFPELGRYLQSDPLGLGGGLNLYAYTNDPVSRVDLRGLTPPKCPDHVENCPHRQEGGGEAEQVPRLAAGDLPTPVDHDTAVDGQAASLARAREAATAEAVRLHATLSRSERQEHVMVAGMHDPETGITVTRTNADGANFDPDDTATHPLVREEVQNQRRRTDLALDLHDEDTHARDLSDGELRERMRARGIADSSPESLEQMRRTSDRTEYFAARAGSLSADDREGMRNEVGRHAETVALNDVLTERDRSRAQRGLPPTTRDELGDIALYNQRIPPSRNSELDTNGMPRCEHCQATTRGVDAHSDLITAERRNAERDASRRSGRGDGE